MRLPLIVTVFASPESTSRPCCPCPLPTGPRVSPSITHQTLLQQCHSRACLQLPMVLFCLAMCPELRPCTAPHPGMAPERCLVLGLRPAWTQPCLEASLGSPFIPCYSNMELLDPTPSQQHRFPHRSVMGTLFKRLTFFQPIAAARSV